MEKIVLSQEIINKHWEYCNEKINVQFECMKEIKGFKKDSQSVTEIDGSKIESIHKNGIDFLKENLEILIKGKPQELREKLEELKSGHIQFLNMIEGNYSILYKEITVKKNDDDKNNKEEETKKKKYKDFILDIFGYDKFKAKYPSVTDCVIKMVDVDKISKLEWCAYKFLLSSGIRVCSYCNRQYITPIYQHSNGKTKNSETVKHKLRADLDHFYPQSKYPYFSMSIHNLVPCCKFCNSSLKGTKEFDISDVNPYEENFSDYFNFVTDISNGGKISISRKSESKKIDNYLDIFQLETLYGYHENQAEELIKKRLMYPDELIDELYNKFEKLFRSKEEFKQFIIGYKGDLSNLNDEVLAKFRRDIAEQLMFIDPKVDNNVIDEKLKSKLKEKLNKTEL